MVENIEDRPAINGQKKAGHRRIDSKTLFQQNRKIEIEHEGDVYLLQITRHNKLILTK